MYCWTEPANGCRICIGSGLWELRTPKVHSAAGELFWLCRPMGSSPAHFDLLCRDPASAGWDGRGIGAIPRDFATLGSANPLAPFQEGGDLYRFKLLPMRGKNAVHYTFGKNPYIIVRGDWWTGST